MVRTATLGVVTALLLAAAVTPGRADQVPSLDTETSCRSAERAAMMIGRSGDNCRSDEKNAKDALARDWGAFSAADKSHCTALISTGGPPSYVELLSCMEMSRDARQIASQGPQTGTKGSETNGAGTGAAAK
jgi:hypothetical protein